MGDDLDDGEMDYDEEEEEEEDGMMEDEDDDDDDDGLDGESEMSEESVDQDTRTMRRIQRDLFTEEADYDDDGNAGNTKKVDKKGQQSRYESRLAALSEQIAELE